MKILIVGASTGLGRALAEHAARRGDSVILVSSDVRDLNPLAAHLRTVFQAEVATVPWHFTPGGASTEAFLETLGPIQQIDVLMFPIGYFRDDDTGSLRESLAREIVEANFLAIVNIVSALLPVFLKRGTGHIVGFGSVATIRGRGRNIIYASAKRALAAFFESTQYVVAGTKVRAQFYVLGYIDTAQNAGKKLPFPSKSPSKVAEAVFTNLGSGMRTCYYPGFWRYIALLLKLLPWPLYRRAVANS